MQHYLPDMTKHHSKKQGGFSALQFVVDLVGFAISRSEVAGVAETGPEGESILAARCHSVKLGSASPPDCHSLRALRIPPPFEFVKKTGRFFRPAICGGPGGIPRLRASRGALCQSTGLSFTPRPSNPTAV